MNGIKLQTDDNRAFINAFDGKSLGHHQDDDLGSEWKEFINEEELDELAKSYDIPVYGDDCAYSRDKWDEIQDWVEDAYKTGYRKAKSEINNVDRC